MATSRLANGSRPRYTTLVAPLPSSRVMGYLPIFSGRGSLMGARRITAAMRRTTKIGRKLGVFSAGRGGPDGQPADSRIECRIHRINRISQDRQDWSDGTATRSEGDGLRGATHLSRCGAATRRLTAV